MLLSSGTWSHADYGTSADSPNIPITTFRVGRHFSTSGALNADMAAMAIVGAEWSDSDFETGGLETGLAEWVTLIGSDPAVLWGFGQSSVSDPVTDLTGGGGDQSAISGTSIGSDPAGFDYSLVTPTDCSLGIVLPVSVAGLGESSSSTAVLSTVLPALSARLYLGASVPPPLMVGSASTRGLVGSATVV